MFSRRFEFIFECIPLQRRYTSAMQALYRHYTGAIQALYRCHNGAMQAPYRRYKRYRSAIQALYRRYKGPARGSAQGSAALAALSRGSGGSVSRLCLAAGLAASHAGVSCWRPRGYRFVVPFGTPFSKTLWVSLLNLFCYILLLFSLLFVLFIADPSSVARRPTL